MVNGSEDHFKKHTYPKIVESTRDAGRGNVTSYTFENAEFEKEESDYFERCDRCGEMVDTRIAKTNEECRRFGGIKTKLRIPYCNSCYNLLNTIGMGEHTELEERSSSVPAYEKTNKEE
jgi:ribosomal protein L37E